MLAGRYELLRRLGEGTTAEVWEARDSIEGDRVAIKFLRGREVVIPQARERFLQEAELLARVESPYVVRVRGSGIEGEQLFLVLDLIAGEDLETCLARGLPPRPWAREVCRDLALGLAAVHAAGIVHRDLKPANVLLGRDGIPRLTDFGLARREGSGIRTQSGLVLGTPGFVPPEVVDGRPAGPEADVFALGVTACVTFTGEMPFTGEDAGSFLVSSRAGASPGFAARLPEDLRRLLVPLLDPDPARRPTAAAVAAALDGLRPEGPVRIEPVSAEAAPTRAVDLADESRRGAGASRRAGREEGIGVGAVPRSSLAPFPRAAALAGLGLVLVLALVSVSRTSQQVGEVPGAGATESLSGGALEEAAEELEVELAAFSYRSALERNGPGVPEGASLGQRYWIHRGEAWRQRLRTAFRDALSREPWAPKLARILPRLDRSWWREGARQGERERRLRQKLLRRLSALYRLERLDLALRGPGGLVPGLAQALEPVVGVRFFQGITARGDALPGTRSIYAPCPILMERSDPLVEKLASVVKGLLSMSQCLDFDPANKFPSVTFDLPDPGAGDDLIVQLGVFELTPEGMFEIQIQDREGEVLGEVLVHLEESPVHFQGKDLLVYSHLAHTLPAEIRIARELLGQGAARMRVRYQALLDRPEEEGTAVGVLVGVGVRDRPIGDAELEEWPSKVGAR